MGFNLIAKLENKLNECSRNNVSDSLQKILNLNVEVANGRYRLYNIGYVLQCYCK
jgi:hypothetical protein